MLIYINRRKSFMPVHTFYKSPLLPIFLCLTALFLTSCHLFCGNHVTTKLVKAPGAKQVYITPQVGISDITTFDPALATDLPSINAISMVFTGLVGLDDTLQVQPQLAQSWSVGSDGVTWTFHLKPNLKFSDGTQLTATDVVYSINRALLPAT